MLVALGAILYWAVSAEAEGVDINLVGLILLIVGIIGLILTLFLTAGPLILTRRTSPSSSAERRERDHQGETGFCSCPRQIPTPRLTRATARRTAPERVIHVPPDGVPSSPTSRWRKNPPD